VSREASSAKWAFLFLLRFVEAPPVVIAVEAVPAADGNV
jgi:hypothetical protein